MREEGKFILVQKYTDGRKRYLCYVLSKTSTCCSNCSIERVCSVREEGEVHVGTKIQIRAKEIFVLRATKINVL